MGEIRVAEMFAGVGGFRLGLEGYGDPARPELAMPAAGPFRTVWANQWEPPGTGARQFAARCYETRFGRGSVVCEDARAVLDGCETGLRAVPDFDMLVGGFPCQDYSVARPLSEARGIEGRKGVLWWEVRRMLALKAPRLALLENVDRLLKSPAAQRGRDFAIILSCLAQLGYSVEWRVVDSGRYGFPQRRRRTYIYAERADAPWDLAARLAGGVLAGAFPVEEPPAGQVARLAVPGDPWEASRSFNAGGGASPFLGCGAMQGGEVATCPAVERYAGRPGRLADALSPAADVPGSFYIEEADLARWAYLKGPKRERRVDRRTGFTYTYSEGGMVFPDPADRPSRTILTSEGGRGASRTKHAVRASDGRLRRLTPEELERLQGFPAGWTATGMTDVQRAFCMGNALVVGIPHAIGREIARREAARGR